MTILELIRKLYKDTHIIVIYENNDEILDFWSSDYFCELLDSQDKKMVEYTEVLSFYFEDGILTIYVDQPIY